MFIVGILVLAVIFQVTAAILAVRLIRLTRARTAWLFFAAAVGLMALRRLITLFQLVFLEPPTPVDFLTEGVGLLISLLLVLGLVGIAPVFSTIKSSEEALRLNEARLEALWNLAQMTTASPEEIASFALEEAVRLTRSEYGFVGLLEENGSVLNILAWSQAVQAQCRVPQRPVRFPLETAGLWAEAVRQRQPLVINDYGAEHPAKRGLPEGHVPLRRLLLVPVLNGEEMVAVAAVANKAEAYDKTDLRQLTLFMTGMWWLLERQKAQAALTAEIERMHEFQARLIQTSSDGIVANDPAGTIVLFNEGAEKILGYRREEVVGRLDVRALYPPGVAKEIKRKLLSPEHGGPDRLERFETKALTKDGEEIPIELSASIIREDSQEVAVVGFFRDLRERQQLLGRLLQAERLAAIGQMAAYLTHEVKNPLMVIGGFARQIRDHLGEDLEAHRKGLEIIIKKVEDLEHLLAETGSYAQLAEPHKVPGDLNAHLTEACLLMEPSLREHHIELSLNLDSSLPRVPFDPTHIHQVILNLLKNALEAMPAGGRLTVSSRAENGWVLVEIADTGVGMPPEILEKCLHAFYSTKLGGSGLGLAICQKVMEAHGGRIQVESQPGQGTRVTLFFPKA